MADLPDVLPVEETTLSSTLPTRQRPSSREKTCKACDDLGDGPRWYEDSSPRGPIHQLSTRLSTIQQRTNDCVWCSILYQGVIETCGLKPKVPEGLLVRLEKRANGSAPLKIIITFPQGCEAAGSAPRRMDIEFYTFKGELKILVASAEVKWNLSHGQLTIFIDDKCFNQTFTFSDHLPVNALSDHSFDFIRSALGACISSHSKCSIDTRAQLPKRVINVGPPNGSQQPFLYTSKGEVRPFVSLSYCWGTSQPLTTTTMNIADMSRGIIWERIPKTIQDAILITRGLGLQYIWIDALCIIQDDEKDWQSQAPLMGSIYSGSYITISASESPSNDSGMLYPRNKYEIQRSISTVEGESQTMSVFVRPSMDHLQLVVDHSFTNMQYPIFTRGWCFQERILARRVLHYTKSGIIFECSSGTQFESGLSSTPSFEPYKLMFSEILDSSPAPVSSQTKRRWSLPPASILWVNRGSMANFNNDDHLQKALTLPLM